MVLSARSPSVRKNCQGTDEETLQFVRPPVQVQCSLVNGTSLNRTIRFMEQKLPGPAFLLRKISCFMEQTHRFIEQLLMRR